MHMQQVPKPHEQIHLEVLPSLMQYGSKKQININHLVYILLCLTSHMKYQVLFPLKMKICCLIGAHQFFPKNVCLLHLLYILHFRVDIIMEASTMNPGQTAPFEAA